MFRSSSIMLLFLALSTPVIASVDGEIPRSTEVQLGVGKSYGYGDIKASSNATTFKLNVRQHEGEPFKGSRLISFHDISFKASKIINDQLLAFAAEGKEVSLATYGLKYGSCYWFPSETRLCGAVGFGVTDIREGDLHLTLGTPIFEAAVGQKLGSFTTDLSIDFNGYSLVYKTEQKSGAILSALWSIGYLFR